MINFYNTDFFKKTALLPDNYYDLLIADPNYGRKQHGGVKRSQNVVQKNGGKRFVKSPEHQKKNWDNKPITPTEISEIIRVSRNQIIWGINYYEFPLPGGRIIWDKCNQGSDQSDCEIAYNSMNERVDKISYMWRGMMQGKSLKEGYIQQGNKKLNEKIIHPTQKPVLLYKWLLSNYAKKGWKILDTHGGSGSSAIAAFDLNFDMDWIEIDFDYFTNAKDRFLQHKFISDSQYKLAI